MSFDGILGKAGGLIVGLLTAAGTYYGYLQYELGARQYEEARLEKAAQSAAARSDPLPVRVSTPLAQERPAPSVAIPAPPDPPASAATVLAAPKIPPESSSVAPPAPQPSAHQAPDDEGPFKQAALASRPAPLGSYSNPRPPDPAPREAARSEPPQPSVAAAPKIVTAIEGEAFALCGQPNFTISIWSPRPNAPLEASLRRRGMMMADGLSTRLERGKSRAVAEDCDVTFVELRSGFKPVAVLEERRKGN